MSLQVPVIRGSTGAGALAAYRIDVAPNKTGRPLVNVVEDTPLGVAELIKASTWLGAQIAADLSDRQLETFQVRLAVRGLNAGASSGAAITAGILAALHGQTVKSDVVITGTITFDGTIGPVGGLAAKLAAAAKAQKRLFGYPLGQRYFKDRKSNAIIDIEERARVLGIEARPIGTIFQAYRLLTGRFLQRTIPVPTPRMALSPQATAAISKAAHSKVTKLAADVSKMRRLAPRSLRLITKAATKLDRARRLLDGRKSIAAYDDAKYALNTVETALRTQTARAWLASGGGDPLPAQLAKLEPNVSSVFAQMSRGAVSRDQLESRLEAITRSYFATLSIRAARLLHAKVRRIRTTKQPKRLARLRRKVSLRLADSYIHGTTRLLTSELFARLSKIPGEGSVASLHQGQVDRATDFFYRAAVAVLGLYRATLAAMRNHRLKRRLLRAPPKQIDVLKMALTMLGKGYRWKKRPKGIRLPLAKIAYSSAYTVATSLFLKLSAVHRGRTKSQSAAVWRQRIKHVDQLARIYAGRCERALGRIPRTTKVYFHLGRAAVARKALFNALTYYRRAIIECQMALRLANKA